MKILFINLPYYGHVNPATGLVQELVKQGIRLLISCPTTGRKRPQKAVQNSWAMKTILMQPQQQVACAEYYLGLQWL